MFKSLAVELLVELAFSISSKIWGGSTVCGLWSYCLGRLSGRSIIVVWAVKWDSMCVESGIVGFEGPYVAEF